MLYALCIVEFCAAILLASAVLVSSPHAISREQSCINSAMLPILNSIGSFIIGIFLSSANSFTLFLRNLLNPVSFMAEQSSSSPTKNVISSKRVNEVDPSNPTILPSDIFIIDSVGI